MPELPRRSAAVCDHPFLRPAPLRGIWIWCCSTCDVGLVGVEAPDA